MSNKEWGKLDWIDRAIREVSPTGPESEGVRVRIELRAGFEMFNTRPYHNYETWSDGWFIEGLGVQANSEDLDDAVRLFVARVREARDEIVGEEKCSK